MKIKVALMGFVAFCFIFGATGTATAKPAGEGAFLTDFATSVSQVVDQVEGNRLVALRYAKHFRTDPSSVLEYFRNELAITTLSEDTTLSVYYMDESRNIVSKTTELEAGTKVFGNKIGTPILEHGTGNPLAATLTTGAGVKGLANAISIASDQGNIVTQVLEQPPTELATTTPTGEAARAAASQPGTMVAANVPGSRPAAGAGKSSFGSSLPGWMVPVGIVGVAAALGGGGGGGGGGTLAEQPQEEPPIPEPAGLLALGGGLAALAGFTRLRRK